MRGALALVLTALLVACGGDPADPVQPSSLVLTADDLPGGWDAAPHDDQSDSIRRVGDRFNRCVGVDLDLPDDAPTAGAPDFSQAGGARQVRNVVQDAGTAGRARAAVRTLDRPRSPECMVEVFQTVLPVGDVEGVEVRDVSAAPLPFESDADATSALRMTLQLDVRGSAITVHLDLVFVAEGRWYSRFQFLGTREPLDPALQHRLVSTVVDRLRDAG